MQIAHITEGRLLLLWNLFGDSYLCFKHICIPIEKVHEHSVLL
uniref:Uncharacterized protein n=1 Tax=Anguilla anguilla TaxID=7936 RepID=A0A0E9V3W5_ANGAN